MTPAGIAYAVLGGILGGAATAVAWILAVDRQLRRAATKTNTLPPKTTPRST